MIEYKINEQRKHEIAAQIWLSYYNRVLFEAGIITEEERNKMEIKIDNYSIDTRG